MSLWNKLTGELVDIIEWLDDSDDTLVWRFPRYANEIKYGAQLVVREGQTAVFVNEGKIADVYAPGTYTLETKNMPIMTTLRGWKYGFSSPFKAEVYFASMRQFTDLKWGTQNPVMMRNAEFGAVRLRAYGTYMIRVKDPALLIRQIVSTDHRFTLDEITGQLRDLIVSHFAGIVAGSNIPVLDLAANYPKLGEFLGQKMGPEFLALGLELTKLLVENISLPPEVEQAMDRRTSMSVVGNLQNYTQFQVANSIPDAAKNPGGLAAAGAAIGLGAAISGQVGQAMNAGIGAGPGGTPPPIPGAAGAFFVAVDGKQVGPLDLGTLQSRISLGLITRQTLVWRQGMAQWSPAGESPELAAIFASVPPPLPKG
ncbi:MAG: SPFH domain-containing protein [Planctomycetota bacterium]|nr:SPFH domain-containing protein [Planctomycetota bacterium]